MINGARGAPFTYAHLGGVGVVVVVVVVVVVHDFVQKSYGAVLSIFP